MRMMGATCGGNSADAGGGWVEASMYQGVSWREKWKGGGVAVQIGTGEWGGRASPYVDSMDDTKGGGKSGIAPSAYSWCGVPVEEVVSDGCGGEEGRIV